MHHLQLSELHKSIEENFLNSENEILRVCSLIFEMIKKNCVSKEDVSDIYTLIFKDNIEENSNFFNSLYELCIHLMSKGIIPRLRVVTSDSIFIESLSELLFYIDRSSFEESKKVKMMSVFLSLFLGLVQKPLFALNKKFFKEWASNGRTLSALKVCLAERYKERIYNQEGHVLSVTQPYENASLFEDGEQSYLMEWHALNHDLKSWKEELSQEHKSR